MKCIYCGHYITYKLKDKSYKCAKCKRKFSIAKIERKEKILNSFLKGLTAKEISSLHKISYATTLKEINNIRKKMAHICEEKFIQIGNIQEMQEYLYIPATIKKDENSIYKAQNFLTFRYGNNYIYNILLSKMENYKSLSPEDIKKMLLQSHIINIQKDSLLPKFWHFFEEDIKKFKGVREENFFLYLKEAEFRFNKFTISIHDIL